MANCTCCQNAGGCLCLVTLTRLEELDRGDDVLAWFETWLADEAHYYSATVCGDVEHAIELSRFHDGAIDALAEGYGDTFLEALRDARTKLGARRP